MTAHTVFKEITVQRLSAGSVLKLVALGNLFALVPFAVVMGVLAALGANTVTFEGVHVHGISAIPVSLLIGAASVGAGTLVFGTAIMAGLWVYSLFRPLTLMTKQGAEPKLDAHEARGAAPDA